MAKKLDMTIPVELLGLPDIAISDISMDSSRDLIIKVESTKKEILCRHCGKPCDSHGYDQSIKLRHLPILGLKTFIEIIPKRGICSHCDNHPTSTQSLEWYDHKSRSTKAYEQYLLFELVNSTVADIARKEEIDEQSISSIIDKHVETDADFKDIKSLGVLGIDEISLRKGKQKYVTIITYRNNGQVRLIKVLEGRLKKDIQGFLKSIPRRLKKTVTAVCSDLYDGYINAAKAVFGSKVITADRFHVAKLYRKSLVNIRKSELKRLKDKLAKTEYQSLKQAIALLRKGRDYFTDEEKEILKPLFDLSLKLKKAYNYSHQISSIFNSNISKEEAESKFKNWIEEVSQSNIHSFNNFIKTMDKYMNEITNYFISRNNSGFVEGFNNRIKALTRRCYGLKNASRLFQRIRIDTEGLSLFRFAGVTI